VEKVMKKGVAGFLRKACADKQYEATILESAVHTDPFTFL
jgi:hypothetical protein